jgi:hypothetical protein
MPTPNLEALERARKSTPILEVFERIRVRAPFVRPKVIELFCGNGKGPAREYAPLCESLEGWEISNESAIDFKQNIPSATVKVCDIYAAISNYDGDRFDVVIVDNSFLKAPMFEHFDLFPDIYRLMNPTCFVVFSVCPDPFNYAEVRKDTLLKAFGDKEKVDNFFKEWDAARDKFYALEPLDPANIPKNRPVSAIRVDSMEGIYKERFEAAGFKVHYTYSILRNSQAGYVMVEAHMEPVVVEEKKVEKPKRKKSGAFGALGGVLKGER